jgi:thiamine pyrophosphate-dependent acetolactate synthase large subunit-like protein
LIDNNHSLNQDKARVDRAYGGVATGNREEIWVFRNVDVSHITPSMGCFGVRVERPGDIQNALEQASASGKPAVVDIASDITLSHLSHMFQINLPGRFGEVFDTARGKEISQSKIISLQSKSENVQV